VREGRRWVEAAGPVVTSAGIPAGIDMSLHLLERFASRDLALATAGQMDFD
jgi:transcriptional regulator GlxA family with amidase domain